MKKVLLFLLTFLILPIVNASTEVSSFSDLKAAIENGDTDIKITSTIYFNSSITINSNVTINGNNKLIKRDTAYNAELFNISTAGTLQLSNITIDGMAPGWQLDYENRDYVDGYVKVPTINYSEDLIATAAIIKNSGSLKLNKVKIQNALARVNGSAISGDGNSQITNSEFVHNGTTKSGGVIFITGGTTTISDSSFENNASGLTELSSTNGGAIISISAIKLELNNVNFFNNFAQSDGGAIHSTNGSLIIKNSLFKGNKIGNDGSAILAKSANENQFLIENTTFEENIGYSQNQSLGTISIRGWASSEDNPMLIKKSIFRNNEASGGGAISDYQSRYNYMIVEDSEFYNNKTNKGAVVHNQGMILNIRNSLFHDNEAKNGPVLAAQANSDVTFENCKIYNNTATENGGAIYLSSGKVEIIDSEMTNNISKNGGAIIVLNTSEYKRQLNIKNTIIKDNIAEIGGGIYLLDSQSTGFEVTLDNNSKLYNNKASVAGDDLAYSTTEGTDKYLLTLNNPSSYGITGIDGWYNDFEGDRYSETETIQKFDDYTDYGGTSVYLKAGGISTLKYDLLGGINDKIKPLTIKYGVPYVIDDKIPYKKDYIFIGWNTKEDATGSWYYANDSYDGSEGLVLYAQYEPVEENPTTGGTIKAFQIALICMLLIVGVNIKHFKKKII